LRSSSLNLAARFARPVVNGRFSRTGTEELLNVTDGRLASWTVIRRYPSPKDRALGLSSIPNSPVLRAELPLFWALRFHSPQPNPADRVHTFQSFGALRNLPCADERSVRARKLGRIRILCVLCFQRFDAEKRWIDTPSILPIFQTRSIVSGPRVSRRTFPLFTTGLYLRHSGSRSARPESGAAAATFALDSGFIANAMPGIP
jgi:hypothetical protein